MATLNVNSIQPGQTFTQDVKNSLMAPDLIGKVIRIVATGKSTHSSNVFDCEEEFYITLERVSTKTEVLVKEAGINKAPHMQQTISLFHAHGSFTIKFEMNEDKKVAEIMFSDISSNSLYAKKTLKIFTDGLSVTF